MRVDPKDIVPFLCKATGKCCIHNIVILSSFDIFNIANNLGLTAKQLFENKILTYRINASSFWMEPILNSRSNPSCPFLFQNEEDKEKYLCKIYDFRPLVCRIYPLKYDKDEKIFLRFLPAENRCNECISTDSNQSLTEYLDVGNVPALLNEFTQYFELLEKIQQADLNLEKIKKNKPAQKKFFTIQSILYETYPSANNKLTALPFNELKLKVEEILMNTD